MPLKIYNPIPDEIIRVRVTSKGHPAESITLCGEPLDKATVTLFKLLNGSEFTNPHEYSIVQVRRAVGGKNKEAFSFRAYGLTPKDIKSIINQRLEQDERD